MYNVQSDPAYRSGWDHSYVPPPRVVQPLPEESSPTGPTEEIAEAVDQTMIPVETPNPVSSEELLFQGNDRQDYANTQDYPFTTTPNQLATQTTTYTVSETTVEDSVHLLFDEISLLQVAGEITEVEAVELRNMVMQGDSRVHEALRQHSLYGLG